MKKIILMFIFIFASIFVLSACQTTTTDDTYTISFYQDDILLTEKEYKYNEEISFPEAPTIENMKFKGWLLDGELFELTQMPKKDIKLVASYEEVSTKTTYKISFYNGKTLIEEREFEYKDTIEFPETPVIEGKYFAGWLLNGEEFTLTIMPKQDIELQANYKVGYTYVFLDYDGSVIYEGAGDPGSTITVPNDPVREKEGNILYTFTGWDKTITALNENVVYIAQYKETQVATLTYDIDGGNWKYYSYDDVVKDLLKDYNRFSGKSYTTTSMDTGAWSSINFDSFYFSGDNSVKWNWLLQYLGEHGGAKNKAACKALSNAQSLDNFRALDDNYKYSVSYELRAFIRGDKLESNQSFPTADYSLYEQQNGFWSFYEEVVKETLVVYVDLSKPRVQLVQAYKQNYDFAGWYDNPEFTGSALTSYTLTGDTTLYAKFVALDPVEEIVVSNAITEMEKFTAYTLEYSVLPAEVKNKQVKFKTSDASVVTVDSRGVLTAISEGNAVISISSVLTPSVVTTLNIEVFAPDHFVISYEGNSYVNISEAIQLNAEFIKRDGTSGVVTWESLTPNIATVNNGLVTGVAEGVATIRAIADGDASKYQDFVVTVLPENLSEIVEHVLESHNSNVFVKYELGIGAGTPAYYADVIGSLNKILFEEYLVDTTYYDVQKNNHKNHGSEQTSTEFITVHYTGNMSTTADGAANASYFASNSSTSIHYTTGNDGIYYVLDEKYVGFHAGDGTGTTFKWYPTGVMATSTVLKEQIPVWGISKNSKFTINGTETSIDVPTGSTTQTQKVTDSRWINDMGLSWKVVDGQYYMGTTWWCYSQIAEGRICSHGGNNNSIGIESCVNKGSDLWYTWQKTAQLVADIMVRQNLDITRVVGHHFYSAKDCPQPLLENDLEIWKEFIKLVEAEYEMITTFKDYEVSIEILNDSTSASTLGRVKQGRFAEVISYKVTITNTLTSEVETITLASSINGSYTK